MTVIDINNNREKWINIARKMGSNHPEDAVQDMILKAMTYGQGINEPAYYYFVLRGCVVEQAKEEKQYAEINEKIRTVADYDPHYFDEIKPEVIQALEDEHFYYVWLYRVYTTREYNSMRKISECTGISLMTIFRDISKIKKIIKEKV